ncbi:MAG TPA: hypothetical protein VFH03_00150 [Actinoplanes sp.]|nr:hypothetical protein [Actinoplanes sp.]
MISRLVAAVVAVVVALGGGPADATPRSAAAESCMTVTLAASRGVFRPDSVFWEPWFDATVRGWSTPCRGQATEGTLAVTQYHVRDGATVGLMSAPWRTAARGATLFSRFGRIQPDVAALCVSTGSEQRDGAVVARHAACVRPQRTGTDRLVTRFAPVLTTDPLVSAPLTAYPAGDADPTGPFCAVDCLSSPYRTPAPGVPRTTRDTPIDGPAEPIRPYDSACHTVTVTDSFAGPSDENVNGFDVWLTGTVDSCDPYGEQPVLHAIRYWPDRGIVMEAWDLAQEPLVKAAQVNENTRALCVASGMREQDGRLYGVHDRCWRIARTHHDIYRLVPIRTDDPRVRRPLVGNVRLPDPDYPPGVCASCL